MELDFESYVAFDKYWRLSVMRLRPLYTTMQVHNIYLLETYLFKIHVVGDLAITPSPPSPVPSLPTSIVNYLLYCSEP